MVLEAPKQSIPFFHRLTIMTPRSIASQIFAVLSLLFAAFSIVLGFSSIDAVSPERFSFRITSMVPLPLEFPTPYFLLGLTHLVLGISLVTRRPTFAIGSYVASLIAWATVFIGFAVVMRHVSLSEGGPGSMGPPVVGLMIFLACLVLYTIYFVGFLVMLWNSFRSHPKSINQRKDPIWAVLLGMLVSLIAGAFGDVAAYSLRKRYSQELGRESMALIHQQKVNRLSIKRRFEMVDPDIDPQELDHLHSTDVLELLSGKEEVVLLTLRSLDRAVIRDADLMIRLLKIYSDGALSKSVRNEALYLILCRMSQSPSQLEEPVRLETILEAVVSDTESEHVFRRSLDTMIGQNAKPSELTLEILDRLGPKAIVFLPQLIRSLSFYQTYDRIPWSIQAIAACGPAAKDALPALLQIWKASGPPNLDRRERIESTVQEILSEESIASVLENSSASVTLASLELLRLPSLRISATAQDRMLQIVLDPSISKTIRQEALFVIASRDLLELSESQVSQLEAILREDSALLNTLGIVLYDSAGFQRSSVQYSPTRTVDLIAKLGKDALPIIAPLYCSLGHQDQDRYVPKIMEAIKSIGPTAIPHLEKERDSQPPESRHKRILEVLDAMR